MTTGTRRLIVRAAAIIMLGNITSRVLGLVREQVIAALFGASGLTDAFQVASTVPTTIYDFLIGGAIAAALIPVFSDYADDPAQREDLSRMTSTLLTVAAIVLAVAVVVLIAFAPQLVEVLGIGLRPEIREQAITLVRIMLPATFCMGISGIFTALLYARQQFLLPAFATAAYNASIIVIALLLTRVFGVQSLVIGVLVGALMQLALQLRALRGLHIRPSLDFSHPGLRRALRLYTPVALGFAISIGGILLDRNLASRTGEGNLAAMRFATTLVQFPLGLIAVALSSAILPTLSRQATEEGREVARPSTSARVAAAEPGLADASLGIEAVPIVTQPGSRASMPSSNYKATLALGIKLAMIAMLPAMVGLIVLREPLVRLLFERGQFSAFDTQRTALAFLAYAPQLPFVALDQLLIAAFYARKNTITPVAINAITVGLYALTALTLVGPWGMPGLAFANSVQNSAHALILLALIWLALGGLMGYGIGRTLAKVSIASVLMGVAGSWLLGWLGGSLLVLGSAVVVCAAVYVLLVLLLRVEEVHLFAAIVRERFQMV